MKVWEPPGEMQEQHQNIARHKITMFDVYTTLRRCQERLENYEYILGTCIIGKHVSAYSGLSCKIQLPYMSPTYSFMLLIHVSYVYRTRPYSVIDVFYQSPCISRTVVCLRSAFLRVLLYIRTCYLEPAFS